jgi:hypothetical protein
VHKTFQKIKCQKRKNMKYNKNRKHYVKEERDQQNKQQDTA